MTTAIKVQLGRLVATPAAMESLDHGDVRLAILRHAGGDWGNVCKDDWKANDEALESGDRLLSSYESRRVKFWIITEWDRSATTVLLPEDY